MSNRWAGVRGWAGVGACSAEGERAARDPFLGKKRSGLKIGNKSRHTFSLGFLDDFDHFQKTNSIKFCVTKRRGYLWKRSIGIDLTRNI